MRRHAREQSGFTIVQLVVVLFIIGVLTYAFSGAFSQQIDNARVTALITKMRQLAAGAQAYHNGIENASIDSNGQYSRNLRALPTQPNQVAKLNARAGTTYPTTNYFGQPFLMRLGAGGYVFVATTIPVSVVGANFNPPAATVVRNGNEYGITVMALSDGGADYERKSRAYKRFLEGNSE